MTSLFKMIKKIKKSFLNYCFILGILWQRTARNLVFLAILSLLSSQIPIGILFLNKEILNIIAYPKDPENVLISAAIFLFLIAIANIAMQFVGELRNLFSALSLNIISKHLIGMIQKKSASLDLKFYDTDEYYKKLENCRRVLGRRWDFLIGAPLEIFGRIAGLITLIGVLSTFNVWLVPIIILGVLPNIFTQIKIRKKDMEFLTAQIPENRKIGYTESLLTDRRFAKEVRLFGFSEMIIQMGQELFNAQFGKVRQLKIWSLKLTTLWGSISSLTLFGVSAFITYYAIKGQVLIGDWQLYISTSLALQSNLNALFNVFAMSYEEDLYADILMDFINIKPEVEMDKGMNYPHSDTPPLIEFRNVSFNYPGNTEAILKDVSFTIKPCEKIALVGLNGSGKSTIIKLLTRLYDPDKGEILFNGVNIRGFKPSELYKLYGAVFQDFARYAFTLGENISISNLSRKNDMSAIQLAAEESGVDKISLKMPKGFDTYISKAFDLSGYSDLSGGDWQKIAIARGFFRNSPIVIMDEPTAALDPEAECDIYKKFIKLCANSTAVVITHRLSSVSMVDRIFLLKDGYIAESGTHRELMELEGDYFRLFNLQADLYNKLDV